MAAASTRVVTAGTNSRPGHPISSQCRAERLALAAPKPAEPQSLWRWLRTRAS